MKKIVIQSTSRLKNMAAVWLALINDYRRRRLEK
jgi:hypothetical protein